MLPLRHFGPNPNVAEKHILTKHSESNSFQVTSDLLNSENLIIVIAQLCNELQVCNLTML